MSANPYAAPDARVDDIAANPEAEAVRRAHISHEASITAVGFLYYIGGVLAMLVAIAMLVAGARPGPTDDSPFVAGLLLLVLGAGQLAAGWGVRALKPWGRIVGCILSALGLLAFPIGTIINAYILYLFLSKKGRTIFAAPYQDVIAATPHVKYRTSILVWIFVVLLVGLILLGVFGAFAGR